MPSRLDALLAQPDIARLALHLAAHPGRAADVEAPTRRAAIALVLRASSASASGIEPELLMIKRAEAELDPWSGHIACPGGRMEPADRDLEQTAIRETWEETGIDLARDGRILGTLDDLEPRTPSLPPLVIRPFVALVAREVEITQSAEVAEAFWVPLTSIREAAAWGRALVPIRNAGSREVDVFRHGSYTVWGLTHRALRQLLGAMRAGG